jgi:TPR repeat protein
MNEHRNEDNVLDPLWARADDAARERDMKALLSAWHALAEKGVWQICSSIGTMYERGADGVEKDITKAMYWYERAIREGDDPIAHVGLGKAHYEGLGLNQDFAAARKHFEKAYSASLPEAGIYLGMMYQAGIAIDRDAGRAEECFKFAADAGYFLAYFKLARLALDKHRYFRAAALCLRGWLLGLRVSRQDPTDPRLLGIDRSAASSPK